MSTHRSIVVESEAKEVFARLEEFAGMPAADIANINFSGRLSFSDGKCYTLYHRGEGSFELRTRYNTRQDIQTRIKCRVDNLGEGRSRISFDEDSGNGYFSCWWFLVIGLVVGCMFIYTGSKGNMLMLFIPPSILATAAYFYNRWIKKEEDRLADLVYELLKDITLREAEPPEDRQRKSPA